MRAFWSVQGGVLDHFGFKQKSDARAMIFLGAAKANRMRKHIFARAINKFWGRLQRARHSRPKRRARNLRPKCASETARVSENAFRRRPRDDPLRKREFCRTLFILLLENDPETYTVPKKFSSESYLKKKSAQVALGAGRRGVRSRSNKPLETFSSQILSFSVAAGDL